MYYATDRFCDCDGNVFDERGDCGGVGPDAGYTCEGDCEYGEMMYRLVYMVEMQQSGHLNSAGELLHLKPLQL